MTESSELQAWRERILITFYLLGLGLGLVVLIISASMLIQERQWLVAAVDLTVFTWAIIGFFWRKRISYGVRAYGALTSIYSIGALLIYVMGPMSGAPLWLFTFAVLAGFLLGFRATVLAVLINAITLTVLGLLLTAGELPWLEDWPQTPRRWWVFSANFLLLNALVASGVAAVFRAVTDSLAKESEAVRKLEEANQRLLEEGRLRHETETSLRESEERYRLAFSTSPDAININKMDGTYIDINQGFTALTGFTREDVIGRPSSEIGIWDDLDDRRRLVEGLKRDGQVSNLEAVFRAKDGRPITALMSANIITLGGEPHILSITRDIDEHRKAQEELQASLRTSDELVQAIPSGLFLYQYDPPDRMILLDSNPEAERLTGVKIEEWRGREFGELWPRARETGITDKYLEVIKTGKTFETEDFFYQDERLSGAFRIRAFTLPGERLAVAFENITARKIVEQQKAELESQLRQAQKMEAIGTLAGGIAHDFNNILAAILGFAEIAHEDAVNGRTKPSDLAQIMVSAERAKELVQQILAFSRREESNLKPCDLNQAVKRTKSILERTLPKMISIETRLAENLPVIQADLTQMEQVLLNLSSNARDAMPEGGRLTIATARVNLDQEYCRKHLEVLPGEYVQLEVSDTGSGMDKETCERIFEPFFTTKGVGEGTGLGLASVFGVIKNHGGHIHCHSEVGSGTVFKIYLPVPRQENVELPGQAGPADEDGLRGGEKILLVDDEESLRTIGKRVLESMGYTVWTARSGEEALEMYRRQGSRPDLLVMDLGMPGMGGQKAMTAILEINPQAKVVIASGYLANGQVKASLDSGAAGYVAKPFRRADLLTTVRRVLDGQ